jgi:oxygen-independent coproporphyrinogen-3 oxidase
MSPLTPIDNRFEMDYAAVRGRVLGASRWQKEAEDACAVLDTLGLVQKKRAAAEWTSGIIGKPYLHALHKNEIRHWDYDEVRSTLTGLPPRIGALYLHFPYCTKHCSHCHYYKTTRGAEKEWQNFPRMLVREIELLLGLYGSDVLRADTVHFGGGTPSLIGRRSWIDLIQRLSQQVDLQIAREIAIEVDPFDLTAEHLDYWHLTGVNRISLGVQSFNDGVLKRMHRQHTGQEAIAAVRMVQQSDIPNLNVDLMHGMPERDLATWQEDIEVICDLKPRSVTCYATRPDPENKLSVAEHFPTEAERLVGHQMAIRQLMAEGYVQYSPNQFILNYSGACLAKNNRNRCLDVLGVGPHAHSIMQGWFYESRYGVENYIESIQSGRIGPVKGQRIDNDEAKRRYMQFGIKLSGLRKPMLDNGISRSGYRGEFNADPMRDFHSSVRILSDLNLTEESEAGDTLALTHEGVLLVDDVVKLFTLDKVADGAGGV